MPLQLNKEADWLADAETHSNVVADRCDTDRCHIARSVLRMFSIESSG